MGTLQLTLFGPFVAKRGGQLVGGLTSPKIQALLAYLALERDRPHHRDALAALLWPEKPQRLARQNLRQSLHRLQSALDDPFLAVEQDTVKWRAEEDVWVDVLTFEEALSFTEDHHHRHLHRCRRCAPRLETAAAVYRAGFLEGLDSGSAPFEEWALLKREWFQQEALHVLDQLGERALFLGQAEEALELARQQVAIDPLREKAHRQMMRALASAGRPSQAERAFDHLKRLLREEVDVAPSEATLVLMERIRAGGLPPPELAAPAAGQADSYRSPGYASPLVGREEELARIAELLDHPACRLLTLAGPGGVGKSRLATQILGEKADEFAAGGHFIPLAATESVEGMVTAAANALGIRFAPGAHTLQARQQELVAYLRRKEMLIVLDNLEHLVEQGQEAVAGLILSLLDGAPRLRLLATSRRPLHLRAEWLLDIAGLPYPPAGTETDLPGYDAVRLFVQTAQQVQSTFALTPQTQGAVAHICRLVEGMPLALELAAVTVRHHAPSAIALAIDENLDFLSTTMQDVPPRHRSLRAVFEHSWALLSGEEQGNLSRLSVFRAGFTPEAGEYVAGASLLHMAALRRHSLLGKDQAGRHDMHELVRQYAGERLQEAPAAARRVRERHSDYYTAFLEHRAPLLQQAGQFERLQELHAEIENVRAAWNWAVRHSRIPALDRGLEGLARYYMLAGLFQEAVQAFRVAAEAVRQGSTEKAEKGDRDRLLIRLYSEEAYFLDELGRLDQAVAVSGRAIRRAQDIGAGDLQAAALFHRGRALMHQGAYAEAEQQLERALALARATAERQTEAYVLRELGMLGINLGEFARARRYLEQSIIICREMGNRVGEGMSLNNLGVLFKSLGDYQPALNAYREALRISQECGDRRNEAATLINLGVALDLSGEYEEALGTYRRALAMARDVGQREFENQTLNNLGAMMSLLGDFGAAQSYHEESLRLKRELGDESGEGWGVLNMGVLAHYRGDEEVARGHTEQALGIAERLGERALAAYSLTYLGEVLLRLQRPDEARAAYEKALSLRQHMGQENLTLEAQAGLAEVALLQGRLAEAQTDIDQILHYLDEVDETLAGTEQPFRIFLICYQVLQVNGDARAAALLQQAHRLLQERAETIGDQALRTSFLNNVKAHHTIVRLFNER